MPRALPFVLLLWGCAGQDAFQERVLGTLPEDTRVIVPVAFSSDGKTAAWVEQRGNQCRAVCGDRKQQPYGVVC
jgi:hypothetical protein